MAEKIHTTIGLYPDNSFKMNGVRPEDLESHIQYNKEFRPGRALFVDGKCVYKGISITSETIIFHEELFQADKYIAKAITLPYQ